jgi:hypothetical protein
MPSILDAMILVAATAAGFGLIRATGMDFVVPPVAAQRTNYPTSEITSGMRVVRIIDSASIKVIVVDLGEEGSTGGLFPVLPGVMKGL